MHRNRQQALQGMTAEEITAYTQCVDHYKKEHGGEFRQSSFFAQNAFQAFEHTTFDAEGVPENDQGAWFDDVHSYGPI